MSTIDAETRDKAAAYVAKHGRYMRKGVYSVRYPLHSAAGLILSDDTKKLADGVAKRMAANATGGAK